MDTPLLVRPHLAVNLVGFASKERGKQRCIPEKGEVWCVCLDGAVFGQRLSNAAPQGYSSASRGCADWGLLTPDWPKYAVEPGAAEIEG